MGAVKGWHGLNNPWVPEADPEGDSDYIYVDLPKNVEKYTGGVTAYSACVTQERW
jgi:hypothetical protein